MSARATRRWRELATAAAIAAAVAVCAPEASAQKNQGPSNSLQGFSQNRDQPVRIRAVALEVREKDRIATFSGDVHVVNGDTELRCKALTVFYDDDSGAKVMKAVDSGPGGERQIKRIEAKGGVTVVQKDQNAFGDTAIFNMRDNMVTLVGNVIVTQGGSVMRGQRLVVDLTSGVSKMDRADVLLPRGASEARKP
jgi:lipopolysaccharide export system protein LptA